MRIAVYAPMKPPDDPVPSGDRETARLILRALELEGHEIVLASRLGTWLPRPDRHKQAELADASARAARRLVDDWRHHGAPDLWLTYHLYHKAPDWIGPAVSAALSIPYVVVEACRAAKHATGSWATGFAQADHALRTAAAVVAMHAEDAEGLKPIVPASRLHRLMPFIDATRFDREARRERRGDPPVLIAVAMMRAGDKENSYRVLAEALARLGERPWRLLLAGDGPRRQTVLSLFPAERLEWHGAVPPERIGEVYAAGDLVVWPAVNEAFGVALLEAQAAGLPAVAGASGGVPEILLDGETGLVVPEGDAAGFVAAVASLLDDPVRRRRMGRAAAAHTRAYHDLGVARGALGAILDAACAARPVAVQGAAR